MTLKPITHKIDLFTRLVYEVLEKLDQLISMQQLQPVYDTTDELLSQKEAAYLLKKDPRTIRRYVQAGIIQQVLIANMPYYSKHEICKLMQVPQQF